MATLRSRKLYKKRLLEALGNGSPAEIGKIAIDMMSDIDAIYDEGEVAEADTDEETFEHSFRREVDRAAQEELDKIKAEYAARFSGTGVKDEPMGNIRDISEDQKQPEMEETVIESPEGNETVVVKENDIFEEV